MEVAVSNFGDRASETITFQVLRTVLVRDGMTRTLSALHDISDHRRQRITTIDIDIDVVVLVAALIDTSVVPEHDAAPSINTATNYPISIAPCLIRHQYQIVPNRRVPTRR